MSENATILDSSENTEICFRIPWLSGAGDGEIILLIPSSEDA